jgi:hypothetical protein
MQYRQVGLKSGTTELVANLPDHPKLKVGNSITLKDYDDPARWWAIQWVSDVTRDKKQIKTTWHNNI